MFFRQNPCEIKNNAYLCTRNRKRCPMVWEFSWLEYLPVTQGVAGSSPVHTAIRKNENRFDSLAQQVEHNTFNVGVLGSSPKRITERRDLKKSLSFLYWI